MKIGDKVTIVRIDPLGRELRWQALLTSEQMHANAAQVRRSELRYFEALVTRSDGETIVDTVFLDEIVN